MKLINIGFGNLVSAGRVVAVVSPDSAPVKRLVKEARERGMRDEYSKYRELTLRSSTVISRQFNTAVPRPKPVMLRIICSTFPLC